MTGKSDFSKPALQYYRKLSSFILLVLGIALMLEHLFQFGGYDLELIGHEWYGLGCIILALLLSMKWKQLPQLLLAIRQRKWREVFDEGERRITVIGVGVLMLLVISTVMTVTAEYNAEETWMYWDNEAGDIQTLLDTWCYDRDYEENVFDCSDMSIITACVLQEWYGYDTLVVWNKNHAWVMTRINQGWLAIECTNDPLVHLGEVVGDDQQDYSWLEYNNLDIMDYYGAKRMWGLAEWYDASKYIR